MLNPKPPLHTFFPAKSNFPAKSKLWVYHIEADICDMCNFSCKNCIRLAPYFKKTHYSFEEFKKDIQKLSTVIKSEDFTLLGGEPLLNDNIMDYVAVLRETKICNSILVYTNGSLLDAKKHLDLLASVDQMHICIYPHADAKRIQKFIDESPYKNKIFAWPKDKFFLAYTEKQLDGNTNFKKCKWKDRCHIVYKGRYFRCGAASKFRYLLNKRGIKEDFEMDGCFLHQSNLHKKLEAYIAGNHALKTCSYCLQAYGIIEQHQQVKVEKIL